MSFRYNNKIYGTSKYNDIHHRPHHRPIYRNDHHNRITKNRIFRINYGPHVFWQNVQAN